MRWLDSHTSKVERPELEGIAPAKRREYIVLEDGVEVSRVMARDREQAATIYARQVNGGSAAVKTVWIISEQGYRAAKGAFALPGKTFQVVREGEGE
jgi:hypothetical protein